MSNKQDPQDKFENIVNNGKAIIGTKCFIDTPLSGEINLSILKNKGIEELHFAKGEISRVYNMPRGLQTLVINNNHLVSLPSAELRDLVDLEAVNNKITKVDLKEMVSLNALTLDNNKIASIVNFPKSLQKLSLNQNHLKELDLHGCESCVKVSTVNNLSLQTIYNAPVANRNFELTKDSHTQLDVSRKEETKKKREEHEEISVKDAVNDYYALKNKYDQARRLAIQQIMANPEKPRQEKIKQARTTQFKCVNCKQRGGTKFWRDNDNNLRAICGHSAKPCNLNISILSSLTISPQEIRNDEDLIEKSKQEIIQLKMDTLFEYMDGDKSVKKFKDTVEKINNEVVFTDNYDAVVNNPEKKRIISKKTQEIYSELGMIRKLRHEMLLSNNRELLSDIIAHYKNIQTNLDNIRLMKYPIIEIIEDGESGEKRVKKFPYSFDEYLNSNQELLKVNKFIR